VAWSPRDSSTLYFVRRGQSRLELVQATLDGNLAPRFDVLASEAPVPPRSEPLFKDLAVAGDGSALAFVVGDRFPYRGGRMMWLDLRRPGAPPRRILEAPDGTETSIAGWTSRQTVVAVISRAEPGSAAQVQEVGADGHRRPPISEPGLIAVTARLDAASDRLYVTATDKGVAAVRAVPLNGGRPTTLVAYDIEGITFGGYAVTRDGWLIYMRKEVNHNVWLFRVRDENTMHDNPRR
jgi:hypothetical protein